MKGRLIKRKQEIRVKERKKKERFKEELRKQEGIKLGAHKTSMQGQKETRKDGKVKE